LLQEESSCVFKGPASDHWPILGRPHSIANCRLPIEKNLNETIKAEFENELQGREKDKQNRQ
jgi:hypothetical protein